MFPTIKKKKKDTDFPGGPMVKNPPANAVNMGPSLFQEDPTCHGATKPLSHNSWAHAAPQDKPPLWEAQAL